MNKPVYIFLEHYDYNSEPKIETSLNLSDLYLEAYTYLLEEIKPDYSKCNSKEQAFEIYKNAVDLEMQKELNKSYKGYTQVFIKVVDGKKQDFDEKDWDEFNKGVIKAFEYDWEYDIRFTTAKNRKNSMKNINTFLETYRNAPQVVYDALENCIGSPEHPTYHPEGTLEKHIDIVVERCMQSDSKELHFAGLLHDIMKHGICLALGWYGENRKGHIKEHEDGDYYQNVHHASHAVKFINLPEVTEWITSHGVNVENVKTLVGEHMRMKNYLAGEDGRDGGMGANKRKAMKERLSHVWEDLYYFSTYCDNMLIETK
jgi:hypothetical protein